MICILLDVIYAVGLVLLMPWVLYRMVAQKRYRYGWKERFGFVPRRHTNQQCIWIHAVSMGEINAAATLINQLQQVLSQFEIIISSTTDTGISRAKKLYGGSHRVFFFPLDFSWAVKRAMGRLQPQLCIMMELEVWPNFTLIATKRSIPVIVANGRISGGKGFPRYRRVASVIRPIFRRLALALVQDQDYAERFSFLGVPPERLQVVGSLKYDTAEVVEKVAGADELAGQLCLDQDVPVWVAGSTGPGEEQIVLECFEQLREKKKLASMRLVIVPRKPERFNEVARMIEARGHRVLRYSRVKAGRYQPVEADAGAVILGDTMGDLRKFYSLARVVFVGRSLVPMGGSDMIEAAGLGKAVIVGPYTENFMESVKLLVAGNGIEVVADGGQLTEAAGKLLSGRKTAQEMGQRARQVIIENKGATQRSVEAIVKLLGHQMPPVTKGIATKAVISE
jgi:3-deoxy-D-manno-octulosonic-acid transferase